MMPIGGANASDALERVLVTDVAAERVTGIRRVGDDTPGAHDFGSLAYEPLLRIFRMEFEALHGRPL